MVINGTMICLVIQLLWLTKESVVLISACPNSINCFTVSVCPFSAARCAGVHPYYKHKRQSYLITKHKLLDCKLYSQCNHLSINK